MAPTLLQKLPLAGVKVLELAGLAPVPFAGMVLADYGANVVRIDRIGNPVVEDCLARGKRSLSLDLKSERGQSVLKRLCKKNDVLIEPFRPGVMEKLHLGPKDMLEVNEKLIYVRLNGYGSHGNLSKSAGHDINYLAISGILSQLGRKDEKPTPPVNLLGDFAGGSMMAVMGILLALFERTSSGKGQVIEASITEGASYVSSFLQRSRDMFIWLDGGKRGENLLDTGAPFYDTYETKDGRYMAVGAIEPQFYQNFIKGIGLVEELRYKQLDTQDWQQMKTLIAEKFKAKTQKEWVDIYQKYDACVTPVLNFNEAYLHETNVANNSFIKNSMNGNYEPAPSPKLSRTPGINEVKSSPNVGEHSAEVLKEDGFTDMEIADLLDEKCVDQYTPKSSL